MATKTPPPPRRQADKGEPPTVSEIRANLDKPEPGKTENLNFKVPAEFKKDFRIAAAQKGISLVELLQETFRYWSQHNS
jgi:hypothetical protein